MTAFSCVPCLLGFNNRDEQMQHLKSDFHTYNLRRQVAELGPVTAEQFQRKLQITQESPNVIPRNNKQRHAKKPSKKGAAVNASTLLGRFSGASSSTSSSEPKSQEEVKPKKVEEEPKDYNVRKSLFDSHESETFEGNMQYMKDRHSLFIHDAQYVTNLEGFIEYLGRKIFEGHQCLYCNKPFRSIAAVRRHMVDRGHKRIGINLEEQQDEYSEFYDYSTSYKELNLPENVMAKLPALMNLAPTAMGEVADDGECEDEWECVAEYEEGEEDDAVLISEVVNNDNKGTWEDQLAAAGFQPAYLNALNNLVLPTMTKEVVHRKHMRQGKRIFVRPPYRPAAPTPVKMITEQGEGALQEQRLKAMTKQSRTVQCRVRNRDQMRLGMRSNGLYRYIARKNKIFI